MITFIAPRSIGIENDLGERLSCDLYGMIVYNDDALNGDLRKDFLKSFGINPNDHIDQAGNIVDSDNLYSLLKLKAAVDGLKHSYSSAGLVVYAPDRSGDRVQFVDEGGSLGVVFHIG